MCQHTNEVIISVKVTPNASSNKIIYDDNLQVWRVYTTAKPIDGEANSAIIPQLAKFFNIPKKNVAICSGFTSKLKKITLSELDQDYIEQFIPKKLF